MSFDLNQFLREKTITEKLIFLIGAILFYLLGWLTKSFPFTSFFASIVENIPKLHLVILAIVLFLLLLIVLLYSFQTSKHNKPSFIPRFNLNWKKTGNKIDPTPYCLCCNPPNPLRFTHMNTQNNKTYEIFECVFNIKDGNYHREKIFSAIKPPDNPLTLREVYELVCKEFDIPPAPVK